MKVVHIVPGSGGTFYCQNCLRDHDMVKAQRELGVDAMLVPMYLPPMIEGEPVRTDAPVFYGAINTYLQQISGIFRHTPRWLDSWFDSPAMLRFAAGRAGNVNANGLGDMTLSMLLGENGRQAKELERLVVWLRDEVKPDIVHLSNALLLGLAHRIREDVGALVFCSLQDEDDWVNNLEDTFPEQVWSTMAALAEEVEKFTAVSGYYADRMKGLLNIPDERMAVVPAGLDFTGYTPADARPDPPTVGYLSRLARSLGLGTLIEAYIILKKDERFANLRLRVAGGGTTDDTEFVNELRRRLDAEGLTDGVDFVEAWDRQNRIPFLQSLSVLSVPVPGGEAFGTFMIEAMAAGVPVVQPRVGAFPEIIEATGGGILYEPNTEGERQGDTPRSLASLGRARNVPVMHEGNVPAMSLAQALADALDDPAELERLGQRGREAVLKDFSARRAAEKMIQLYRENGEIASSLRSSQ